MNQELLEAIEKLTAELKQTREEIKVLRMSNVDLQSKIYDLKISIEESK